MRVGTCRNRLRAPLPTGTADRLHFDAAAVVHVLGEHVRQRKSTRVSTSCIGPRRGPSAAGGRHDASLRIRHRCTRLPRDGADSAEDLIQLDWIPPVRRRSGDLVPRIVGMSRIVARPHGWIFQIPLRDWTSCGYVFNPRISSDAEIADDFTVFLHEQGLSPGSNVSRQLSELHPSQNVRRPGLLGGNAASFIEPLRRRRSDTPSRRSAQRRVGSLRWTGRCAEPEEIESFNRQRFRICAAIRSL